MKKWVLSTLLSLISSTTLQAEIASQASVPVVNMNEFFQKETKQKFIDELKTAFSTVGFVAVTSTDVDTRILDRAYDAAKTFFQQDFDTKMEISAQFTNFQRGYVPGETARGSSKKDFKEFLHTGRDYNEEQYARLGYARNIWPDTMDLKTPINDLYTLLEGYMIPLEEAISLAMGQHPNFIHDLTKEGDVLLRSSHYPANPPSGTYWAAPHTDIDLYTILPRASAPGLQLQDRDGNWIDVVVPDGSFIINCGDMIQNLTNGEFRSALHQVVSKDDNVERFSMVFFVHPRPSDCLNPLPNCIEHTGGVRLYPNATRDELLADRLIDLGLASEAMIEKFSQTGLCEQMIDLGKSSTHVMKALRDRGLASEVVLQELAKIENE